MLKKLTVIGAAVCALSVPVTSFAGPYIGAEIGSGKWDTDFQEDFNDGSLGGGSFRQGDIAGGIRLGYQFDERLAGEIAYRGLGKSSYEGESIGGAFWCEGSVEAEIKASAIDVTVLGNLPISDNWSLLGRVGMARWDAKASFSDNCGSGSASDKGTDFTFGGGFQYERNAQNALRLEFQQYTDVGDEYTVRTFTVGVISRF